MQNPVWTIDLPEGESNGWRVERFEVSHEEAKIFNIQAHYSFSMRGQYVLPGSYTRLMYQGHIVMSDTPLERRDHFEPVHRFKDGHIGLVNGLGLGMVAQAMLTQTKDSKVYVVEKSADVIHLVEEHYYQKFGQRMHIIHDDALTYKPPSGIRFNVVWHDIWTDICADNLPQMHKLHRKYGRLCDWQGSWRRQSTERLRRTR